MAKGKVVQVIGTVVDVEFPPDQLPALFNAIEIIPLITGKLYLKRKTICPIIGSAAFRYLPQKVWPGERKPSIPGSPVKVPVGKATLGRLFNVLGEPLDDMGKVKATDHWPIHRPPPSFEDQSTTTETLETGLKALDLITPFTKGGKIGAYGGAGVGKDCHYSGAYSQYRHRPWRIFRFYRYRRAFREGNDLWNEMKASGVIDKTVMVFGQMNEPPGVRLRVGMTGLTMAEYFRDSQHMDVLLFIDNIYRYTLAGMEVSALLGRMPSAVGYQPTLATEVGELEERITSTKSGSITSFQAVYVPADDYTDPGVATTFGHLDAVVALERSIAEQGLYPAVDPLTSTSRILDPRCGGRGTL